MTRQILAAVTLFLVFIEVLPAQTETGEKKNRVIVMGMIHSNHLKSQQYDLEKVRNLIRKINPDAVFCEIPPDRIDKANQQYKENGKITESRVRVFPEYVDVLYPLTKEMDFEMYACAGWTKEMADARRKKLQELIKSHKSQYEEMIKGQKGIDETVKKKGGSDNPELIHSDEYDEIVKKGLVPYDKHFNELLGAGGWTNINKAHYDLVDKNLNKLSGQGKTILIMFGAWHKYWFKEQLRKRSDIELINLNKYLKDLSGSKSEG